MMLGCTKASRTGAAKDKGSDALTGHSTDAGPPEKLRLR